MTSLDGISYGNHNGFKSIMGEFKNQFECSYLSSYPPVHSKIYIWRKEGKPTISFLGSANYTQTAFLGTKQREVLTQCDEKNAIHYFDDLIDDSIYCTHPDAEDFLQAIQPKSLVRRKRRLTRAQRRVEKQNLRSSFSNLESVSVSLLDRDSEIHKKAGLNWGQRQGREPNQAYIQLSPEIYRGDFFPIRSTHFTVLTDDDRTLICTRAQKNPMGAAIETPHNNSLLGEYFRSRLGLANGAFVNKEDLEKYGRTNVTFYKIDDENYYMDFSVE